MICTLHQLSEEALVDILTEPKNAICKQYQKLFEMDGVQLGFDTEALKEIARIAISQKTGARGLRSIMERFMLKIMYEIPDRTDIQTCQITKSVVSESGEPVYTFIKPVRKKAKAQVKNKSPLMRTISMSLLALMMLFIGACFHESEVIIKNNSAAEAWVEVNGKDQYAFVPGVDPVDLSLAQNAGYQILGTSILPGTIALDMNLAGGDHLSLEPNCGAIRFHNSSSLEMRELRLSPAGQNNWSVNLLPTFLSTGDHIHISRAPGIMTSRSGISITILLRKLKNGEYGRDYELYLHWVKLTHNNQ